VDDSECTEASPEHVDTRRPLPQSKVLKQELHNTDECDALFNYSPGVTQHSSRSEGELWSTQTPFCVPRTRGSSAGCDDNRGRQPS